MHAMIFFERGTTITFFFCCSVEKLFMRIALVCFLSVWFSGTIQGQDLFSQQKQERVYKSATDLLEKNQFGAARESFTEFISLTEGKTLRAIEAEYFLAYCALNLFHLDAEKLFSEFIARYPDHPKAVFANFDLANFFYREKNYQKAAGYYSKLDYATLTKDQQNVSHFRSGYSLFNQKMLKDALSQFNQIKSQGGQYGPAASYYAGFIEYSQRDFENAQIDLKRAEQNESYAKIVPYLLANVYYKQKKYDELLSYSTQVTAREGSNNAEEISLLAAEALYQKGDNRAALSAYSAYLKDKAEVADKGVLLRAGYSAFLIGKEEEAFKYLKLSFSDGDSIGFYSAYYLGSLYLKKGQKEKALTSFGIARMFLPDQKLVEESSFQFAKISYDLGLPDQSILEFEKLLKRFPQSEHAIEVKELLAQAYVNANNYNKAIEYIESLPKRGVALDRAYQKATLLKGLDLFNKEDYKQAIQFFTKSTSYPIDQDYFAEACFWNGEATSILKQYESAIQHYQKVIRLSGYANSEIISKTRYGLGYAHFNSQQYEQALFNFKEFVTKSARDQPNLSDGVLRLADCQYVSKDYTGALVSYRKAINFQTADVDYAHLQIGVILGIQRKYAESANEFDLVVKNYPQSRFIDEVLYQRAQLDFEQGNYATALAGYSRLLSSFPASRFAPYAFMRRAACYYNQKDFKKTADDYITVLTKYPSHPASKDALLPLQESLNLAGKSAEFDKYLAGYKSSNPDGQGIELVEFEAAKNLYFNQDYARAIERLTAYITHYKESIRVPEATYYLAEAAYRTKDLQKALDIYYLLSKDKVLPFANKVVGRIAELEFRSGKFDKAIPQFLQLSRVAGNKKEQFVAWNGLMESYFLLAQYDSSKVFAENILRGGSANAGATNKASLYLGKIAKEKGDFETAKDEFLSTLNSAQDEYGAEAKYLLGEVFYLSKDYNQCYLTLISMNSMFSSYTEWVGKSYLLLSDNFLAMGDLFNAKAVLKSLVDNFPLESVKTIARDRLAKLDQADLKKLEKAKADATENDN